ncbi:MAG: hypothetical protein NWE94_03790 [Candidatus Bathyarchaeota archaeon]|nr:hypothetical protein [Candidatus Bathyarchaeota archaeon]
MSALTLFSGRLRLRFSVVAVIVALVLAASVVSSRAVSEVPAVEWSKTYGELQVNSVVQTADGGYVLAGSYGDEVAVLAKVDSAGGLQWRKSYGAEVFGAAPSVVSVVQTADLGFALFGEGGYLVKTDTDGVVQWSRNLGLAVSVVGAGSVEMGIQTSDGAYVLVGNTAGVTGENVAWLIKTNEQGDVLWNKTFTGGFNVRVVLETNDRGCGLAGSWRYDFWFAKIDVNSNLQWSQTYAYGEPTDFHYVSSAVATKDGGYVLAGAGDWRASGGVVPWLIKINSQGHGQWSLPYGHIPSTGFSAVVQTADEGYMVALSDSPTLIRMDSSGSEKWDLTYADLASSSSGRYPIYVLPPYSASSLIRTSDGGYAVAGTVSYSTSLLAKVSAEPDLAPPTVYVSSPQNKTYDTSDVVLTFTVNEPVSWVGYSLDGQDNVTIAGNTTLSGLSKGEHALVVYAEDAAGNRGASATVYFTVVDRFPIEVFAAAVVTAAVVSFVLLFRFKPQVLRRYVGKQAFKAIVDNGVVRSLMMVGLCIVLVLVQFFFPFFYLSSVSRSQGSQFEVGVSYVYEQDNVGQIYDEVARIRGLGISVIRVNMVCDSSELNDYMNSMTDVFFTAAQQLNMRVALIIHNNAAPDEIRYYLNRWGKYLAYVQILNEPELSSSWDVGALFTDDEAVSKFEQVHSIVKEYHLSAQLYTNFGAGFIVRSNLPIKFSEKLNFVGYDVFMESFLTLSPTFIQLLQKITNKDIVITEFGMSTSDDAAQSDYITRGLNLFKNMGLKGCWIVYWNSANNDYGIRGRLAEKTIGEWIAQNA